MKISVIMAVLSVLFLAGCKSNDASDGATAQTKKKAYHCEQATKLGSMISRTRCITHADKEREEQKSKEAFRDSRAKAPRIHSGG
ncbi:MULTISPECIES: hypothetical protein [Pseudoalteromonas]|uniref:Lipoprotein n=1 Tax=Pseudoalteromonas amylolytica TaxID=1859457 RepID=A0A1S1MXK1_9GAMM|nr:MULTISPECIES: hypothetical protein [Pseudoalteromonas]MCF6436950.1 hypothetical protein [Pseudoalteromonas sp. MMG022]OHU88209.1 hypothetical protein BFC16_12535 [Pseudoalteromonas sp. JW3]OHU91649.1 hypothetical protein BET10_12655 [Pseudoalteromonas amylolytica]